VGSVRRKKIILVINLLGSLGCWSYWVIGFVELIGLLVLSKVMQECGGAVLWLFEFMDTETMTEKVLRGGNIRE
jgi:hypothetical protein